jgi:hypothetical protein
VRAETVTTHHHSSQSKINTLPTRVSLVRNLFMIRRYAKSVGSSGAYPRPASCKFVESLHRKMDYDLTEITIRVLGSEDPDPTPETYTKDPGPVMIDNRQTSILTYRSRNAEPQRQSKRIRTVKRRVRRIGISKQMSVKDIKLLVRSTLTSRVFFFSCR